MLTIVTGGGTKKREKVTRPCCFAEFGYFVGMVVQHKLTE
jgi:hypothetical protein